MARVKSQMRRYTALGCLVSPSGILKTGTLELDPEAKELRVDGARSIPSTWYEGITWVKVLAVK